MSTWTDKEPYPEKFVPSLLADTWNRYQAKEKPAATGKDRFPVFAGNPLRAEHQLINKFLAETWSLLDWNLDPKKYASGRTILNLDEDAKVRTIMALVERYPWLWKVCVRESACFSGGPRGYSYNIPLGRMYIGALLKALLRNVTKVPPEQFAKILTAASEPPGREMLWEVKPKTLVKLAATMWPHGDMPTPVKKKLEELEKFLSKPSYQHTAEERKLVQELRAVLGRTAPPIILYGEAWSDAALSDLKKMSGQEAAKWLGLLTHCQKADGSKPTQKWAKAAGELVNEIGREKFTARVLRWFELVALPRTVITKPAVGHYSTPDPHLLLDEANVTVLRGLVWCLAGWKDARVSSALSTLAEVCFKKVRWLGPRCPRVGNACLYSLSTTTSEDAAAQLSRLDSTVKQPTAKKRIGKSLDTAASLTGQTREDLEEKSVPNFGLNLEGNLSRAFGNYTALLQIVESRDIEITWSHKDGKSFKAAPAEVKRDHATALKEFQKLAKDLEKMLTAQRIRIERLLMTERDWDFESWRHRYFDHPLLANITRRLIWHFKLGDRSALGAFFKGKIVDVQGRPLTWLKADTRVRLWHAIGFALETVAAWRDWLQKHEVCQPFKQAHREVYILTDAEVRTKNYSNRFAAHILGQHQFAALCKQRGWKYQFMGGFDFQSTPTLELPAWNLSAEFWVQPTAEMDRSGVSRYLATDQVRFVRNETAILLSDVPAIVFSEVMRDVDLFVDVSSVGNDPEWRDQGEVEGGGDYWTRYSFGDLAATAQTRRDVLQRLLPKLKIANRCALEEKFLRVKGDLRTYRIHLGSGNIQMEPNAQYLCIVPNQGAATKSSENVFLPFEGDRVLSIILSKAFLLADDVKIKDPSILSQIGPRR
jgi:hypothetical protein